MNQRLHFFRFLATYPDRNTNNINCCTRNSNALFAKVYPSTNSCVKAKCAFPYELNAFSHFRMTNYSSSLETWQTDLILAVVCNDKLTEF